MFTIDPRYREALQRLFGILCIGVGIVGLFLPIIQGTLLILFGLSLLHSKTADALSEKIKGFFKKLR